MGEYKEYEVWKGKVCSEARGRARPTRDSISATAKEGNKLIPKRARPPEVHNPFVVPLLAYPFPPLLIFKTFPLSLCRLCFRKLIPVSVLHTHPTTPISLQLHRHVPRCISPRTAAPLRNVPAPTPRCAPPQPPAPAHPQSPSIH